MLPVHFIFQQKLAEGTNHEWVQNKEASFSKRYIPRKNKVRTERSANTPGNRAMAMDSFPTSSAPPGREIIELPTNGQNTHNTDRAKDDVRLMKKLI